MDYCLYPSRLAGQLTLPDSKSLSHRRIFMAMLSRKPVVLSRVLQCDDTKATLDAFQALGGAYQWQGNMLRLDGRHLFQSQAQVMPVQSSASTLRFMIPFCLSHGGTFRFAMNDQLSRRSLAIYEQCLKKDVIFQKKTGLLTITGQLQPGTYRIDGSHSSQFISGLLMALPLLEAPSRLQVISECVSSEYIQMTLDVMQASGIEINAMKAHDYIIKGGQNYHFCDVPSQADASAAAFFKVARYLGQPVSIEQYHSCHQADEQLDALLERIAGASQTVNMADMPDLVPALSLAMALSPYHYELTHAARLRDKESDRLQAVCQVLSAFGADIHETADGLVINGVKHLHGAQVSSFGDHRIVMMAAIAASIAEGPTMLYDGECVTKSWPDFFQVYHQLGGRADELPLRKAIFSDSFR